MSKIERIYAGRAMILPLIFLPFSRPTRLQEGTYKGGYTKEFLDFKIHKAEVRISKDNNTKSETVTVLEDAGNGAKRVVHELPERAVNLESDEIWVRTGFLGKLGLRRQVFYRF